MPRNRNRNNGLIVLDEFSIEPPKEPIRLAKDYLKNNYYNLLKEKGEKIECAVCMEEIDCKNCFCLLTCGHYFHLHEVLKCNTCPLCRS